MSALYISRNISNFSPGKPSPFFTLFSRMGKIYLEPAPPPPGVVGGEQDSFTIGGPFRENDHVCILYTIVH
jgi:hypothetical protein